MRKLSLLVPIFISALMVIAEADELDYLKEVADKAEMHYAGLTNGPAGHRSYLFLGRNNTLLVAIPEEISSDREADLCFHAGLVSARSTWDLMDSMARKAMKEIDRRMMGEPTPR